MAKIPCTLYTHVRSKKLMIYFHGNGEDLKLSDGQMSLMRQRLGINILAMEYPEYQENYLQ